MIEDPWQSDITNFVFPGVREEEKMSVDTATIPGLADEARERANDLLNRWSKEIIVGAASRKVMVGDAALFQVLAAEIDRLEERLKDLIGTCAPPIEALCAVHHDGKYIAPATLDALKVARDQLRDEAEALVGVRS